MSVAIQRQSKLVDEDKNVSVSFTGSLDSGEALTGTPTVAEVGTSDLTLSSKVISTAALTINGVSVAAGLAVQFHVTGGVAGTTYTIRCQATTDSTPAQKPIVDCILDVR